MFELERFVDDCLKASGQPDSQIAIRELLREAMSDPASLLAAIGEPSKAGLGRIHVSDTLTILNLAWGPGMTLRPHNHQMWAVIGIYGGREDNIFWRRIEDEESGEATIEAAGAKTLRRGDVATLGWNIIHSVTNPLDKLTGGLHVYGGNFFEEPRSEWDPEALTEQPLDTARLAEEFERSNRRMEG